MTRRTVREENAITYRVGRQAYGSSEDLNAFLRGKPQTELFQQLYSNVQRNVEGNRNANTEDKVALKEVLDLMRVYSRQTPLPLWKVILILCVNGLPKTVQQLDELVLVTAKRRKLATLSGELIAVMDKSGVVEQLQNYTELLLNEES